MKSTFSWKLLARAAGLAGLYLAFARLGSVTALAPWSVSAVWPAAGLGFAAIWWGGYRLAPAIGLGTFVFARLDGAPILAGAGGALANMIEPVVAVFLIRRYLGAPRLFDRVRHVFRFFLYAGVVATALGAVLGAASLCWGGVGKWEEFSRLFLLWWAGDLIGAVIVAPALLAWTWPDKSHWTAHEGFEASAIFVMLTVGCLWIFGVKLEPLRFGFPAAYPLLPVIMWTGLRLGRRATTSATLLVGGFAVWGTLRGTGPFAEMGMSLLMLHLFMSVAALTGLVLAASVTERSDAESGVHESEARKTAIFETAFDAILSIDQTGILQEWNPAAERMFGYRCAEALGRPMDELIVPAEVRQRYLQGLADYLITGVGSLIGRPFELLARRADGQEIPVELAITRVPRNEPPSYTVVIRDLTRRKAAESALRQSEERLRMMVESVKDYAIYMLDPDGRVATWNAGAERLKGYRTEEILRKPFATFFTPEDVQRGVPEDVLKKAREEGQSVYEGLRVRKDGSRFWVQGIITVMRDETGKLYGYSKVAHDITELKRIGEALQQSETRFRLLVEDLPQLIWTAGPDGSCDYMSPQWSHYTGVPEEQLIGLDGAIRHVHPEDRTLASTAWKRAFETGRLLDVEFRIRRKDGVNRWFKARAVPLRNAEGRVTKWIGANTDIDDQKRAREILETKIKERTAQLQASFNSMEELLYTIAHDLRAPNRSMQGFAQLLQAEHANQLNETARDYLSRISAAAVRNDELIRDLLEYGRLSHEPATLAPVDTRQTVGAVLSALEKEIQKRHAHIHPGQEWPLVLANEPLLNQILTNLVSNALIYVPAGREPEIVISAETEGGKAVLRVKDNGVGISPEHLDRIFKPFVRLPNPINAPGTGMGLAIAQKAVERMNGVVGVESTPEKGSCFWVELPSA